jgi:hypothetical protein
MNYDEWEIPHPNYVHMCTYLPPAQTHHCISQHYNRHAKRLLADRSMGLAEQRAHPAAIALILRPAELVDVN